MAKKHISFWIEDKDLKECDANVIASDYESRSVNLQGNREKRDKPCLGEIF